MNLFEEYIVTSPYGLRKDPINGDQTFHRGIDLVKHHQAPIKAFVGGKVVHAKMGKRWTGLGGYGNVVAIKDKNGALHCYCHLHTNAVKVGDVIEKDHVIGYQGNTGRSTGSHLHYEIRKKSSPSYGWGTHIDPTKYLKEYITKSQKINILGYTLKALIRWIFNSTKAICNKQE